MPTAAGNDLPSFVDSNIWIYAFVAESAPTPKGVLAQQLVARPGLAVSTQVINEFCCYLVRKAGIREAQRAEAIEAFYRRCLVMELSKQILLDASALRVEYSLSFWDSLIIASALQAGCATLYSEDMHDGLLVRARLRIVNPFAGAVRAPSQG